MSETNDTTSRDHYYTIRNFQTWIKNCIQTQDVDEAFAIARMLISVVIPESKMSSRQKAFADEIDKTMKELQDKLNSMTE